MMNDQSSMTNDKRANGQSPSSILHSASSNSQLTVEVGLWVLIAVLALGLRLASLDVAPLDAREAHEANLAWRAVTGLGSPEAGYSPALLAANALLFALCGASDALARFWPALSGGVLALTPVLLRERLGRAGALAAGVYLALSPTVVFASRQLDGAIVAVAGTMATLGGLAGFFDTGKRVWLAVAAGGLALAVTSSPSAYGLLLALGLAWLLLAWVWPAEGLRQAGERLRPHLGYALAVFLLVGLALATGLGWNLGGLGAVGDLLAAWLARFSPVLNPVASPLALLAIYEPLALFSGVGGLVWAIRRGHRLGVLLGLWAGLGGLLLALMPGRAVSDVLWVLLPLAMLAGVAVAALVRDVREQGGWLGEGLYGLVVVILWAHLYLALARYTVYGSSADLALALLTVALQILLALMFALALRVDAALRAVGVGTLVMLLAVTLASAWGGAYVHPADPRELLAHEPAAIEVRDLVQTLRDLSWRKTGAPTTQPFTFEAAPDSALAWYLRDFSAARRVEELDLEEEPAPVVVTTRRELAADLPEGVDYVGQGFALRRSWDPHQVGCAEGWPPQCITGVRWLLYRNTPTPPVIDEWAVLWLRRDVVEE